MNTEPGHPLSPSQREQIGPFELERLLGRGGMAETFVAIKRGPAGFEQKVCVKRILPVLANDPNMVRLFLDEARNTASLRHNNIVQVIDFGTDGGNHYLALELVDGIDLHHLLEALPEAKRGLPADLVTHIAVELSATLDYAHKAPNLAGKHGVFHRDVSPSNVLVSDNGDLKLTDFGVAKAAGQARATAAGVVRGKVEYMAPEYGMGGEYDARCDQYSLGVLLFEILTGVRPYLGNSQGEVLHRARQGFHRPLSTLRQDAPAPLVEAIERMIRPTAEQRFASMADVTRALMDIAPGPRGRAQLGQWVTRVRSGEVDVDAAAAVDGLSQTVLVSESPVDGTKVPQAVPITATSTSASVQRLTARSNRRIIAAVACVALLLLAFGVSALLSHDTDEAGAPGSAATQPDSTGDQTNARRVELDDSIDDDDPSSELPVGVEPPIDIPQTPPAQSTQSPRGTPATSTRSNNVRPAKTPHELIHRQKHDLIKPKEW